MRIVRFQQDKEEPLYGILESDSRIVCIEGDILGQWRPGNLTVTLAEVQLLAPVQPPNILAIGLNYRGHALESNQEIPKAPVLFLKATTAVTGPERPIVLPAQAPDEVDYEAELVIVIGKRARRVRESEVPHYVLGYTCGNDISARDCQQRLDVQWARAKSFDTFAPIGPWIETELEPEACRIQCRVNGETMQDSTTRELIFSSRQLVSYLSHCMTLLPGTLIMTGTPSGVGASRRPPVYLRAGDLVEVEIEGIGILRNCVTREDGQWL